MRTLFCSFAMTFAVSAFAVHGPHEVPPMPDPLPGETLAPPAMEEAHPDQLVLGASAPGFDAIRLSDSQSVRLSSLIGKKPVVLLFGSDSCPVFRGQIAALNRLAQADNEKADFFFIYIREAHPGSKVFLTEGGKSVLRTIEQTDSLEPRMELARRAVETFHMTMPVLVDNLDNAADIEYAAWPVRFVVIDREGKLAYKGRLGPFGFWPDELEDWLKTHLVEPD